MSIEQYLKHISWIIALSIFLIGCQTVQENICTFPDAPDTPAPNWVCDQSSIPGTYFTAVGIGESENLKNEQCLGSARLAMAERLQVTFKSMFQEYIESTGGSDEETLEKISKSVIEQLTDTKLQDTSLKKQALSPKGTLYCLVAMELSKQELIAQAINTAKKNNQALWKKFKAKMSIDEMSIDEMRRKLEAEEKK